VAGAAGGLGLENGLMSDAASHLLAAGGKRLRPTLALCAAYAAKGADGPVEDVAVTGAATVELVHLGSLYHDDVIDEAETRRGVPSVNARWSNIVAILAGDYLLAQASELAASLGADVAALLARTIGELCRGQVLELQDLFDVDRTEESYYSSVAGKTASLMATACRIGGMVSRLEDEPLDALTAFGHHLGMCFQIVDDVLDVTRTDEDLGKPAGNDLHEGVYTLPVIHALSASPELRSMLGRSIDWPDVARAREMIDANGVVERSLDAAREHASKASSVIRDAPSLDSDVTRRLTTLVDDLVDRSS
jgi:heptaprenyl diphosphate synthase